MLNSLKICLLFFVAALALPAFTTSEGPIVKYPKKVNAIIQDKCYGCHSADSKAKRAMEKLRWDELAALPKDQALEKMNLILQVLDEGSMPPKRMLERFPDKKLTDKETAQLKKWATKTVKKLNK
ncbi:MAG: hypothetical protein EP344_04500 [Bacteroidetes bacterium]|nr:MAG: hypothetical protein EP344_04500 [Bacteroidota bacterium]